MFEQIRNRIQHVQQDLTSSIYELTFGTFGFDNSTANNDTAESNNDFAINHHSKMKLYELNVNLNSGVDIIDYFQTKWIDIKNLTHSNIELSESINDSIKLFENHFENNEKILNNFNSKLDKLVPEIDELIDQIEMELNSSCKLLSKLNDKIIQMEKRTIDFEHQQRLNESESKLNDMIVRKAEDLVLYEQQLRNKLERQEEAEKIERQLVFQQVFEEELKLFKEKGLSVFTETNKHHSSSTVNDDNCRRLEDISLDIDQNDAEEFEKFLEND